MTNDAAKDVVDVVNDPTAKHPEVPESVRVHDFLFVSIHLISKVENLGSKPADEGFKVTEINVL